MNIIILGASGMVGASALREALADASVTCVLSVGRRTCGVTHAKLKEVLVPDLFDIASISEQLSGYDACIWAIGISSVGMDEAAYSEVTERLTLAWAEQLLKLNPEFSFCYCSAGGAGGRSMWAQVRQRVETRIGQKSFLHAGVVRPGFIQPGPGIRSRTPGYQAGAAVLQLLGPAYGLLVRTMPFLFTTSQILGTAMLRIVKGQSELYIHESADINRLGRAEPSSLPL